MVELVDTRDLKSLDYLIVRVRLPIRALTNINFNDMKPKVFIFEFIPAEMKNVNTRKRVAKNKRKSKKTTNYDVPLRASENNQVESSSANANDIKKLEDELRYVKRLLTLKENSLNKCYVELAAANDGIRNLANVLKERDAKIRSLNATISDIKGTIKTAMDNIGIG